MCYCHMACVVNVPRITDTHKACIMNVPHVSNCHKASLVNVPRVTDCHMVCIMNVPRVTGCPSENLQSTFVAYPGLALLGYNQQVVLEIGLSECQKLCSASPLILTFDLVSNVDCYMQYVDMKVIPPRHGIPAPTSSTTRKHACKKRNLIKVSTLTNRSP